ncbi:hypothetical protein K439DRAFT_1345786, partial [Ramaria rubella]
LYWAISLMDMVYRFMRNHQAKQPETTPGIQIPNVCFVHSGLALIHGADGKTAKAALLEEVIDTTYGDFHKFIHNGLATPLLPPSDPDYMLASFLSFAQHIQWTKTGGLAFILDFQGEITVFVQICGLNAQFSQGNVGAVFRAFPEEHECNSFCNHFSLSPPDEFQEELSI